MRRDLRCSQIIEIVPISPTRPRQSLQLDNEVLRIDYLQMQHATQQAYMYLFMLKNGVTGIAL
jgi:hypothetical protein